MLCINLSTEKNNTAVDTFRTDCGAYKCLILNCFNCDSFHLG